MTDTQNTKDEKSKSAEAPRARNNNSFRPFGRSFQRPSIALDSTAVPEPTRGARVGPSMSMEASITLHTKLAVNLWKGRKATSAKVRDGIPGVLRFAREASKTWNDATLNNHVADMYLILTEERYEKACNKIEDSTLILKELLDVQNVFDGIGIMNNTKPFKYDLKFSCPWGYLACALLKKYDDLIRLALTAKHIGFLGDADWKILVNDVGRAFRGFLQSLDAYIPVPIDRIWFEKNMQHKIAKVYKHYSFANREMPVVPDDIFKCERRPQICPPIRNEKEREHAWEILGPFTNEDMTKLVKQMPIRADEAKKARKERYKAEARKRSQRVETDDNNNPD